MHSHMQPRTATHSHAHARSLRMALCVPLCAPTAQERACSLSLSCRRELWRLWLCAATSQRLGVLLRLLC
jgi:hypothetical protein